MNGRFAAEKIEFIDRQPIAPGLHPTIGLGEVEITAVPVIGIVTAAIASQMAGVGHMQFEPLEPPALPGKFSRSKPQRTGQAREKSHDKGLNLNPAAASESGKDV